MAIPFPQLRSTQSGFTIIEMMIVVMIVAIAAALAVPQLGETGVTKLSSAAKLLAADLGYAQVESIGHGADLRVVVFDVAHNKYHIAAISDPATPITNPITKAPYEVQFGQGTAFALTGVTISSISVGGDTQLKFGTYGQLDQATAATVTLAVDGFAVTLSIHPVTGEVTVGSVVSH